MTLSQLQKWDHSFAQSRKATESVYCIGDNLADMERRRQSVPSKFLLLTRSNVIFISRLFGLGLRWTRGRWPPAAKPARHLLGDALVPHSSSPGGPLAHIPAPGPGCPPTYHHVVAGVQKREIQRLVYMSRRLETLRALASPRFPLLQIGLPKRTPCAATIFSPCYITILPSLDLDKAFMLPPNRASA